MSRTSDRIVLPVLLAAAGIAHSAEAKVATVVEQMTLETITAKVKEFTAALPAGLEDKITPEHEAQAAPACRFFAAAAGQAEGLNDRAKADLGRLGVIAGFVAGDPDTMVSGAKLLWAKAGEGKDKALAAIQASWAGLLGGDSKVATEALDYLQENPPARGWDRFAAGLKPIAATCGKRVRLDIKLLNGKHATSSNLKGKAVVLDFWATWCRPCVQSIPIIRKFHDQRKDDKNFVLISLSLDQGSSAAIRGIRRHKMKWHQAMDNGLAGEFGVRGIPHMILLSADGRMIYRAHPAAMDRIEWVADFALRQARRMAAKAKPDKDTKPAGTKTVPGPPATASAPAPPPPPEPPRTTKQLAHQKYQMAMAYRQSGLNDKAAEILREIVRDYPKTPAAAKARNALGQ